MEKELTEAKSEDQKKQNHPQKKPRLGKRQKRNKELFNNRDKLMPVIPYLKDIEDETSVSWIGVDYYA
jgi:hypothetical protein